MHVGDATRPRPEGDSGGAAEAKLMTTVMLENDTPTAAIGDGKLTVKVQRYGWNRTDDTTVNYGGRVNDQGTPEADDDTPVLATVEFDLETLAGKAARSEDHAQRPEVGSTA